MGISTRFCKHFNLTPDIGQGSDTGLGTSHTPYIMWCVHTKLTVQCDPWPPLACGHQPPEHPEWHHDITPGDKYLPAWGWPHSGFVVSWLLTPRCQVSGSHDRVSWHGHIVTHLGCHGTLSTHISVPPALTPSYYQNTNSRLPSLSKWVSFL